jgi:hypothetical protein
MKERSAHIIAVNARQIAIEHDDVVCLAAGFLERLRTVQRDIDRHTSITQSIGHVSGEHLVVLYDQNPHASMVAQQR